MCISEFVCVHMCACVGAYMYVYIYMQEVSAQGYSQRSA